MSLKAFRETYQEDAHNINLQTAVRDALKPLTNNPILDYVILKGVVISGTKAINHGLQRAVQGWVVTRIKSSAVIFEVKSDDNTITLTSTSPAVIDLYIF